MKRVDLDRGHTGATAQIVLVALLAFAIVASTALIVLPRAVSQRTLVAAPDALRSAAYFGAVYVGGGVAMLSVGSLRPAAAE